MSIFNLFKKKKEKYGPIRIFSSDADKFSTKQITELMEKFRKAPDELPPVKSDDYVKGLIKVLEVAPDINVMDEVIKNDVRIISFSIERNGFDYVSLSYQLFNPDVVYITTAPYGFSGDRDAFLAYVNRFQLHFPMISIGCKNMSQRINLPEGETILEAPMYAVRTCVPMLGCDEQDLANLEMALRTLPIYGYDLRDGFHSHQTQPYASKTTGLNIQLEKLVNMHQFNGLSKELYPAEIALFGHAPFKELSTEVPGRLSNPYLQYLNFCSNPEKMFMKSDSNQILHFRMESNRGPHSMERVGNTQLICYTNYPTLYTIEANDLIRLDDNDSFAGIYEIMSSFSFPSISDNPHEYALYKVSVLPYDSTRHTFILKRSMTICIPNEVIAATLALQIVDFFDKCGLDISTFITQEE